MKLRKNLLAILIASTLPTSFVLAQDPAPKDWMHADPAKGKFVGVSSEKAYELLKAKGKKPSTIVVAVIDSGVDVEHEDLKDIIWKNPKEVANNGVDDDKNGYVDDVHGWSFLCGKNGTVDHETLELTRLYRMYKEKFENADESKLSKNDKKLYEKYQKVKAAYEEEFAERQGTYEFYKSLVESLESLEKATGKKNPSLDDIKAVKSEDASVKQAVGVASNYMKEGKSFDDLKKELGKGVTQLEGMVKYNYNIDFDPRNLIGDNYANQTERNYGCSDVEGPDASHGTHVAGIIAAVRGNRIGMDGIANNVRIMSVRVVPDGDERDKDVANGIRYAVDNGASIINMSFGKSFSFNKKVVDDAVKYALSKDVLLVHAAGNDGKDNDNTDNFPNPRPEGKNPKRATNWVEVGAANWKTGADAAATFSNYGKLNVDLFSPGVDIYSTIPDNKYDFFDGTSMASPACAGVAAILRSYFPELTAPQVRDILMATVTKNTNKIFKPGRGDKKSKVDFTDLCITGGVVNAEKAVALALTTKGKKKVK